MLKIVAVDSSTGVEAVLLPTIAVMLHAISFEVSKAIASTSSQSISAFGLPFLLFLIVIATISASLGIGSRLPFILSSGS